MINLNEFENKLFECYAHYYPRELTEKEFINDQIIKSTLSNSPSVVFICDYKTKGYTFVSENSYSLFGVKSSEYIQHGITVGLGLFAAHQYEIIVNNILPTMFQTFIDYGKNKKCMEVRVSYTTIIRCKDNSCRWFLNQLTVIETDSIGLPLKALKIVTDINDYKSGEKMDFNISIKNSSGIYERIVSEEYVTQQPSIDLSRRELEVLQLISQGFSSKNIAEHLCISQNTVNNHRKNMLIRSKIKTTGELVKEAFSIGLIR